MSQVGKEQRGKREQEARSKIGMEAKKASVKSELLRVVYSCLLQHCDPVGTELRHPERTGLRL
jgi:hypothetical protein